MKTFKSKVDVWLALPFLYPVFLMISDIIQGKLLGLFLLIIGFAIGMHTYISTKYTVNGKILKITSSILINKEIQIDKIRRIEKTKSFLSSPALSLDRIEIFYNKFDSIIISPKEKQEFLKELVLVNPDIVMKI